MDGERSAAAPLVVFTSRPNSHPFQERHISCQDAVKIGRSVARAHPAPANAIFDCKVLSRNHALLWFEENKYYLQDTKSSNGTFVNNQRLSKGSEESNPHEIFSGDIIQFGVDVMENSKRVTHGCIMASITLYLPDGTEAKPRFSSGTPSSPHSMSAVHSQEMYQLSQYLQEALHREQILQEKMTHMQSLLHTTNESCESSWHALINEDRLLSKLEVLQNQLSVFSKNQTEGSLQQQLLAMEEERLNYETGSKESLRKVLEEKIAAIQELSDVERSLANAENECKHLRDLHQESRQQLADLTQKYEAKIIEHSDLFNKLQEAEQRRDEDMLEFDQARSLLQAKLEEALADRDTLQAKVMHLQAQQASQLTPSPEEARANGDGDDMKMNGELSTELKSHTELPVSQKALLDTLRTQLDKSEITVEEYQNRLNETDRTMMLRDEEIQRLNQHLEQAQLEIVEYVTKVATLEERSRNPADIGIGHVEQTTDRLQERIKQINISHEDVVRKLRDQLENAARSQSEVSPLSGDTMHQVKELQDKLVVAQSDSELLKAQIEHIQEELSHEQSVHTLRQTDAQKLQDELNQTRKEMENQSHVTGEFKAKSELLESRLQAMSVEHQELAQKSELDNATLREEALQNKKECEDLKEECCSLRSRIQAIEDELQRLQQDNGKLDTEVTKTKGHNEELANEISKLQKSYTELRLLKDSLETRESSIKDNLTDTQKEAQALKEQLGVEKREREELLSKYDQSVAELRLAKEQVEQTQALHSDTQQRLEVVTKELATVTRDFTQLTDKSKTMSFLSTLPIMVLMLAVALALYPFLTRVTTSS